MVSASRAAATQFTASPITMTEKPDSTAPKARAASGSIRPRTMGRPWVRVITASISRSYHMLMAPDAPAPMAMHRMAMAPRIGWIDPGARYIPTKPVNTTSDMTRGFSSST